MLVTPLSPLGIPRLGVNVDHVATVRQARGGASPDPVAAAVLAEQAGADGITVHLREDRRHIQDHDVERLSTSIRTVLNCELATSPDVVALVVRLRPFQATLVPERREEITTEGGLDLTRDVGRLREVIAELAAAGSRVSLFIDPDKPTIDRARALDVPAVELHTGRFAHTWPTDTTALADLRDAAIHALEQGLAVHAGHGLTYDNVAPVAAIQEIEELNIGHSIVSRAVLTGMYGAVSEMRRLVAAGRAR
jgi:pyridoxine 5-phosphate synthase